LNVHAPSEEESDESKDSFYEELKQVFNYFCKYHMKIMLGDFNAQVGGENIFKLMIHKKNPVFKSIVLTPLVEKIVNLHGLK